VTATHVETELLAYLDGELSEPERARVEAHLAKCPRCAAELDRLRTLQQELDATFDVALGPVRLAAIADFRIRDSLLTRAEAKPRLWWMVWPRRGVVAQALLAVLVLALAFNTLQVLRLPTLAGPHETLVLGQDRLAPGSKAALRVLVRAADETTGKAEPVEGAEVSVRIGRTPGLAQVVYTGRTNTGGTAQVAFAVPEDLEGQASLVVETSTASGEDQIIRPITVARDYKLFLSSDKPAYRPSQMVHMRVLALDNVDLQPAVGRDVEFTLLGPAGRQLMRQTVATSDFGIAGFEFRLPADAAYGHYTLRAALGDTASERTVSVGAYELPAFRVTIETDRTFYQPGEHVTGAATAEYFFGRPVADGRVTLRGYLGAPDRMPVVQVLGDTDDQGRFEFAFDLPSSVGSSATDDPVGFDLEVDVVDMAGQRAGIRRVLPVAAQPILINAVAESGLLRPGVENVIFLLTSYPDGQTAETTLIVVADGEEHQLATGPYGLAEFRTIPTDPTMRLAVHAHDAQGAEGSAAFTFESERGPATLLLRTERATYEVGDTLRAEALVAGIGDAGIQTVYLDVVREGQAIAALSAPVEGGRTAFALDLDETAVGTLELRAYRILSDGETVQDARRVVVDMPRQVVVAVTADQEQYHPGDTAHIQIETTLSTDKQAHQQTALGLGVVDESVYALETLPPGFARAYFLLERELLKRRVPGLDVPALLDAEAEAQAAQDAAAQAAWAGVPPSSFTLSAQSITGAREDTSLTARTALSNRLGLLLVLLALGLGAVVVRGLGPSGVRGRALRRVGIGTLVLLVTSPVVAVFVGGVMWLLWIVLGVGAPIMVLLVVVALLVGVAIHGWWRRDARVQLASGLLAAYLVLGGLLVVLAGRGFDPAGLLLALIAVTFLLIVVALATLGQGLVLEGWLLTGWATTLLGLLLIPLVVYLPFIPGMASDLTHTLGNPALYAGPVGWLAGCAPMAPEATPEPTEAPAEEAVVEATMEPAPAPTTAPTAAPTASPVPLPAEPLPLRQVFPETLYWDTEALTDENGYLALDLPLADNITTWRLTALAATRQGELGVATYDIVVFQDFFAELDLPAVITRGDEINVSVTLYNYLPQTQVVRIEPAPGEWYSLVTPSRTITLPPNEVATGYFSIRAEQTGRFSLEVAVEGERMSDAVAKDVTVEP
jgi:anti-sigma factor RsiW